jgi:hypothetical protein
MSLFNCQQVKLMGAEPGLFREYFIDERGKCFVLQDEGPGSHSKYVWYTTDRLGGEPGFVAKGYFEIVEEWEVADGKPFFATADAFAQEFANEEPEIKRCRELTENAQEMFDLLKLYVIDMAFEDAKRESLSLIKRIEG